MDSHDPSAYIPTRDPIEYRGSWQTQPLGDFRRELLASKALEGVEPLVILERSGSLIAAAAVLGVILISIDVKVGLGGVGGLVGFLLFGAGAFLWLRSREPVFTLERDGVRIGTEVKTLIPWHAVADFHVDAKNVQGVTTTVRLSIELTEGYVPFYFTRGQRLRYQTTLNTLRFQTLGVAGMKSDKISATFARYWQAGLARNELQAAPAQAVLPKPAKSTWV